MKGNLTRLICTWLALFCTLAPLMAKGQSTNGSITGTILDPTGLAIPDAHITATNIGTRLTQDVQSNGTGTYLITSLPPGQYSLTVEHQGFKGFVENLTVTVAQSITLNVTLQVGQQTQTVTVNAGASLINTTNAEISNVVDENTIKQLPLNGRDPSTLMFLSPGVNNVLNTGAGYNQTSNSMATEQGASAGGGQQGSTYALLDGIPNMDFYMGLAAPFPNADATQEFRAITNNFGAEYGFSPGAVVTLSTKAGTNAFHGGLFEFVRNQMFNAANPFSGNIDLLKQNQFGGYIGGPIIKDKVFFFQNYQETRQSDATGSNLEFTPTQAELNGDFSALAAENIFLSAPFATVNGVPNQINPNIFSPISVAIAKAVLPISANPEAAVNGFYVYGPHSIENDYEDTARVDYILSDKQRMFARSFIQTNDYPAENIPGDILVSQLANHAEFYNEAVSHTWIPKPDLVNVISAAWINMYVASGSQLLDNTGKPFCLSEYINVADPPGCYAEGFGTDDYWSTTFAEPNGDFRSTWWLSDGITATKGKHTILAGVNLARQYDNTTTDYPAAPFVNFGPTFTGDDEADFLLGYVNYFQQGSYQNSPVRGWQFALYGEDRYKVRPNLTVTAGVRWEPDWAPQSLDGGAAYVPGQQSQRYPNAPTGLIYPGDKGINLALRPSSNGYILPRVGVAWQPFGSTSVIRAGFGMFAAPIAYSFYNHMVGIAPFAPNYVFNNPGPPSAPYSFQNPWSTLGVNGGVSPFPAAFEQNIDVSPGQAYFALPITLGSSFSRNFRLPITQAWNLSFEQQMGRNFAFHLAYVGSESYHQTVDMDLNPGIYSATIGEGVRSNANFAAIDQDTSLGTASYNSMQATLENKLWHGIQFQTNFTWSKVIDLTSWGNQSFSGEDLPDPFNIAFNRGISVLNLPLSSVSDFIYTSPGLNGHNDLLRQVAGSWEIAGIWTFQSGQPFTIGGGDGDNNSGSFQYHDRADVVPGQVAWSHRGNKSQWLTEYFNTAAFQPNPAGTFGDVGKDTMTGPYLNYGDLNLAKNWKFGDGRDSLQFRCEMFNAFNHPSYGLPGSTVGTGNFGVITGIGAEPPRVIQLAMKFAF